MLRTFKALWFAAFISICSGAVFQLLMQPGLSADGISFKPDWDHAGDLIVAPGRLLGHMPGLFLLNASIIAAGVALIFVRSAPR
jgi:hypothetical protein